jgi:predicted Zn finger-like uncharacterized protein
MAIEIQCPECSGRLRVGDHLVGKKVKCPKCKAIFPAREAEEEEVVDEIEEEEEERPRKRKSRDDDDEERISDRIRKRRRDDDDEDEDEDRPRKKRRRDDDEDEDDDYDRPRRSAANPKKELQWVRLGTFLMFIGSIVTLSAIGLEMLLNILARTGAWGSQPDWVRLLMVGLPGLGGMCTFMTGLVFGILGPKRGPLLGLGIALVAISGLHLLFTIICLIPHGQFFGGIHINIGTQWNRAASALPVFSELGLGGFDPLPFFTALFEVATLVLLFLWLRALMLHYKRGASVVQSIIGICISGGAPLLLLIMSLVYYSIGMSGGMLSPTTVQVMSWISFTINFAAMLTVWGFVLLFTLTVNSFLEYQKPK